MACPRVSDSLAQALLVNEFPLPSWGRAMGFMSLDGTGAVELAFIGRVFYFRVIPASLFYRTYQTPELSGACEASRGGQHMARSALWQGWCDVMKGPSRPERRLGQTH